MAEDKIFLALKNQLSELERLRRTVAEFGQRYQLPARLLFEMNLALEEIVVNIISHGFEAEQDADIWVSLCLEHGELRAEVQDNGKAFNPLEMPLPDTEQPLEQRSVGGLGLHLVRTLMDEVVYQRQDNRNILALKKKVRES